MKIIKRIVKKDKRRQPIGMIVIIENGINRKIGYAVCNSIDKWNNEYGTGLALNRALNDSGIGQIPKKYNGKSENNRVLYIQSVLVNILKELEKEVTV